ncbi:MAG: hypothetical protein ACRD1H_14425 [Vicinamibacterales bacterium]
MRQPIDDDLLPGPLPSNDWGIAAAIAVAIVISVAAFLWIFFQLEPFMSDFAGADATFTPDSSAPIGSPTPAD